MRGSSGLRIAATACAAICVVLWSSACGPEKIPALQHNLAPAERFRPYGLFYAGRTFDGLPMTGDGSREVREYRPGDHVTFVYGQCRPSGEHDTCGPPVMVANYPICYFPGPKPSPRRTYRIRGRAVTVHYDYGTFDGVEVRTGTTTIIVNAGNPDRALRVVRRLRAANREIDAGDPLPPPRRVTSAMQQTLCGRT